MNKLVGVLAVVVACLLAASPAWSAKNGFRTGLKVSSTKAPVTVYVVLCDNAACETGGTLCPGINVNDIRSAERGSCTTTFDAQGLRVYASGGLDSLPPADTSDPSKQATYVTVDARL
jgi:hypothetical protein